MVLAVPAHGILEQQLAVWTLLPKQASAGWMLPGPILKPPGYASQVQEPECAAQAQKSPVVQVLPLLTPPEFPLAPPLLPVGHFLIYSPGSIHHLKTPVFSGIPYGTYSGSPSVSSDAH